MPKSKSYFLLSASKAAAVLPQPPAHLDAQLVLQRVVAVANKHRHHHQKSGFNPQWDSISLLWPSMSSIDRYLFYCTLAIYLLSTLSFLLHLFRPREQVVRIALSFTISAFALHSVLLIHRYVTLTHFPVTDLHHSLLFFTWSLVGVFLIVNAKYKVAVLGSFVTPLAAVFLMCSATILTEQPAPIPPALRSFWVPVHSTLSFIGEAIFGLAFCVGVMYLIQENQIKKKKWSAFFYRLPSLKTLDDLNYLCIT